MPDRDYTIEDLERLTGFTRRQIRFYITKKLVPGAGDRGPNAVYSSEALTRLRVIAHLKDLKVPPTGRRLSLDEIAHTLDSLPAEDLETVASDPAALKAALDADEDGSAGAGPEGIADPSSKPGSASEYLKSIRPDLDHVLRRHGRSASRNTSGQRFVGSTGSAGRDHRLRRETPDEQPMLFAARDVDPADQELHILLSHLRTLLEKLGRDARFITRDGPAQWQRITADDIEIHVRQPSNHRAKARLADLARALERRLDGEEET